MLTIINNQQTISNGHIVTAANHHCRRPETT